MQTNLFLLAAFAAGSILLAILWRSLQLQKKRNDEQVQQINELLLRQQSSAQSYNHLEENLTLLKNEHSSTLEQLQSLQSSKGKVEVLTDQLQRLQQQLVSKDNQFDMVTQELSKSNQTIAGLNTQIQHEKIAADEKIQLLENAKKQLSDEFKLLANQIFEQKQTQFTQTSQASIEAVLKPMQGVLDEFKKRVEVVHSEDLQGRASLTEQLKQLHALNSQMTTEAQNLTHALKGDSKTQGNWGELVLERLLERSGLTEGIEFDREKSFTDENGKRLRPDVIINMPDNKHVIIDSKVSLTHYEQVLNNETKVDKNIAIKSHLASLKKHISTLAEKRYEHLEQLNAPDFILMFVPVEGAYLMAIEADSGIFEDAFEKRVAVVTPTTLFTTLKTIEQLWRYERQSENTVKLIKRAADVHDKFVGFVESFEKVGSQLNTAQKTYDQARKQMVEGQGNLVRQAAMLKDLAGKTKKEIPRHLLDETEGTSADSSSLEKPS